jgi:hypothetical protein
VHSAATLALWFLNQLCGEADVTRAPYHVHSNIWMMTVLVPVGARVSSVVLAGVGDASELWMNHARRDRTEGDHMYIGGLTNPFSAASF